jgi:hypothetical protein
MLDVIPHVLIISISLFVIGLLDNLFTTSMELDGQASVFIRRAAIICSAAFGIVVAVVFATILHALIAGEMSPFYSGISRSLSLAFHIAKRSPALTFHIAKRAPSLMFHIAKRPFIIGLVWLIHPFFRIERPGRRFSGPFFRFYSRLLHYANTSGRRRKRPNGHTKLNEVAYAQIMLETYDDKLLNDACAALSSIINIQAKETTGEDIDRNIRVMQFLLSPLASSRSSLAAASLLYSDVDPRGRSIYFSLSFAL